MFFHSTIGGSFFNVRFYWTCSEVIKVYLTIRRVIEAKKELEHKLILTVRAAGGIAPKLIYNRFDGMPDRLILLQIGRLAFIEVKVTIIKPRPIQLDQNEQLRGLGFWVYILDDEHGVNNWNS